MKADASASPFVSVMVARLRRVRLPDGRVALVGYQDDGKQLIAKPAADEPGAWDVFERETPTSLAFAEEQRAREARARFRRSKAGILASIRNLQIDDARQAERPLSQKGQREAQAREVIERLGPLPPDGDEVPVL